MAFFDNPDQVGWITTVVGFLAAVWQTLRKQRSDEKKTAAEQEKQQAEQNLSEIAFQFEQYKELVRQLQAANAKVVQEHAEDRQNVANLQISYAKAREDHAGCREELARVRAEMSARIVALEDKLARLEGKA